MLLDYIPIKNIIDYKLAYCIQGSRSYLFQLQVYLNVYKIISDYEVRNFCFGLCFSFKCSILKFTLERIFQSCYCVRGLSSCTLLPGYWRQDPSGCMSLARLFDHYVILTRYQKTGDAVDFWNDGSSMTKNSKEM